MPFLSLSSIGIQNEIWSNYRSTAQIYVCVCLISKQCNGAKLPRHLFRFFRTSIWSHITTVIAFLTNLSRTGVIGILGACRRFVFLGYLEKYMRQSCPTWSVCGGNSWPEKLLQKLTRNINIKTTILSSGKRRTLARFNNVTKSFKHFEVVRKSNASPPFGIARTRSQSPWHERSFQDRGIATGSTVLRKPWTNIALLPLRRKEPRVLKEAVTKCLRC